MIKVSILWEDIKILNVYAPLKYIRQKLTNMKGAIDKFTSMVEDISTLFLVLDRRSRQKMCKEYRLHKQHN